MKKHSKKQLEKLKHEINIKLEVTNIKEDLSDRLKNLMKEQNWTSRSLGKVSGVSYKTILGILNEKQNITVENLHKICLALDIKIYDFLKDLGWHQPEEEK